MVRCRVFLTSLVFGLLPVWCASAPRPDEPAAVKIEKPESRFTIAVADFDGADKDLGNFLADTLLTHLTQSRKLQLVERSAIRKALAELKLQSTGLVEPQQVKQIGKIIRADHLLVGSFMVSGKTLMINVRLLDVKTGLLDPGGAANVSGNRDDLLALTLKLAKDFHRNFTQEDLPGVGEAVPEPQPVLAALTETPVNPFTSLQQKGLVPVNVHPDSMVTESELTALLHRVVRYFPQNDNALSGGISRQAVTRLRCIAALIKMAEPQDRIRDFHADDSSPKTPDSGETPTWGLPFVGLALMDGWLPSEEPFKARNIATWAFLADVLAKMPMEVVFPKPPVLLNKPPVIMNTPVRNVPDRNVGDIFTGLIVDAGDFDVQRGMSPRILDPEGNVVYPDPKYIPDDDYVLDQGMVSYLTDLKDGKRAGNHPLIVQAIDLIGAARGELVVSDETAKLIREADRRSKFLAHWSVCFLTKPH